MANKKSKIVNNINPPEADRQTLNMAEVKKIKRLTKIATEFNVGIATIVDFLIKKDIKIDSNPNTKVNQEIYDILVEEFGSEIVLKKKTEEPILEQKEEKVTIDEIEDENIEHDEAEQEVFIKDASGLSDTKEIIYETTKKEVGPKIVGKIDLDTEKKETKLDKKEPDISETKIQETIVEEEQKDTVVVDEEAEIEATKEKDIGPKVVGQIDLDSLNQKTRPAKKTKKQKEEERKEKEKAKKKLKTEKEISTTDEDKISKSEEKKKPVASSTDIEKLKKKRKKRRRRRKDRESLLNGTETDNKVRQNRFQKKKKVLIKYEVSEEDIQKQVKDTLARLTSKTKSKTVKHRRLKREVIVQKKKEEIDKQEQEKNILKITEFVSVNEISSMMNVPVNEIIATCMNLGLFVSINQRLDAEIIELIAEEFGYKVKFVSAEVQEAIKEDTDSKEDLVVRSPIVTVMGHVDHGKTSLLDFIRKTNVIAGEQGGITQHIGAYNVSLGNGRQITFLDTPGHEAFTAMRARGAQVTDLAIIVIASDDNVMPQTVEAINHAQAAGVPIVFAINKIDKPEANPEKIKEQLANMNFTVDDWGGKYQSQEISAKYGNNINELFEKVLFETDLLDLKANPNKKATGTVIESALDKGRGYVSTLLVRSGTLKIGDILLAGSYKGHVKAMYNERNQIVEQAKPSMPVLALGLNGAPQAGDNFNVMNTDQEAKEIANKREQLQREQGIRTQQHITLDEIGRRIAIGSFKELNIIVKGDVNGSVEALSDSLIKLSVEQIQVNVIHKAVGQISESDVLLASASNAIIIGFQVRPSIGARKLAEKEGIDIRLYSIIYNAINELKDAMQGMLVPDVKEEIVASVEIIEVFKISKLGNVAGCIVKQGKITRNTKIRVIREGIVVYTGELNSLKHFKDDVKEVEKGHECGLGITNFNDIKVGDIIEGYKEVEVEVRL